MKTVSIADFNQRNWKSAFVIDVRTSAEFDLGHLENSENHPLDTLCVGEIRAKQRAGELIYLVSRSGKRARMAYDRLVAWGVEEICVVDGGWEAWLEAGFNTTAGKSTISLERQIRIAAGGLVVTGVVLSMFVSSGWIGLSAFIGLGLVFAGITDTCGLGMLLSTMPWNKRKRE